MTKHKPSLLLIIFIIFLSITLTQQTFFACDNHKTTPKITQTLTPTTTSSTFTSNSILKPTTLSFGTTNNINLPDFGINLINNGMSN